MLSIVLTTQKLLAGVQSTNARLLPLQTQNYLSTNQAPLPMVLKSHIPAILEAYQNWNQNGSEDKIPTTLALPVEITTEIRKTVTDLFDSESFSKLRLIHTDNLAGAYLTGLSLKKENYIVLECLEDYLNLCYCLGLDDRFEHFSFPKIGPKAGREAVLNDLIKRFADNGVKISDEGKKDFERQLSIPSAEHIFSYALNNDIISLEAEARLPNDVFSQLMVSNHTMLKDRLQQNLLTARKIHQVVLLGQFLGNESLTKFFKDELKINELIYRSSQSGEWHEFETIIKGLQISGQAFLESERKKLEAQKLAKIEAELQAKENRESLLAEIRERCTNPDLQTTYEERYVSRGADLGIPDIVIKWTISEVINKINLEREQKSISVEVSNPVKESPAVEKVAQDEKKDSNSTAEEDKKPSISNQPEKDKSEPVKKVEATTSPKPAPISKPEPVVENKADASKAKPLEIAKLPTNGASNTKKAPEVAEKPVSKALDLSATPASPKTDSPVNTNPVVAKTTVLEKPAVASKPAPAEKSAVVGKADLSKAPAPTNGKVETKPNGSQATAKPEVAKPEIAKPEVAKAKEIKEEALKSLGDIFIIKGALPDSEFTTKKVMMKGNPNIKVVKLLPASELDKAEKVKAFEQLYQKELTYYNELSELSMAKEGKYYYREYIDRTTLKNHIKSMGLNNKNSVDEMSSTDLKFILQILKEVKDLPVSHADINEENILVVNKRKWNLQKNQEIRFVGFSSTNCSKEHMIQQTHQMFERQLGQKFYAEFRKKFQL